jgi:hypothetical protein
LEKIDRGEGMTALIGELAKMEANYQDQFGFKDTIIHE